MNDDIDFLRFQQIDAGTESVAFNKYPYPTIRTQVEAPCPGLRSNLVTLVSGSEARDGIKRPKNVGTCAFHVAFYEKTGTFIGHYTLEPGEEWNWINPPPNTWTIKFGCQKNCGRSAILEYDTPYFW